MADPSPDEKTLKAAARVFPECSDSVKVLVLVDEAHRSHTSVLHACLRKALPNAARVGFTGTPLMQGRLTDTGRIFGLEPSREAGGRPAFLDTYRMDEAEKDKVIVPVRYEDVPPRPRSARSRSWMSASPTSSSRWTKRNSSAYGTRTERLRAGMWPSQRR